MANELTIDDLRQAERCPFCGGAFVLDPLVGGMCDECGATGPDGARTEAQLLEFWNKRAPFYNWRPVEKETGDGPFLGWGPGWLSVQSVYRSSYVHDGKRYSFWDFSEDVLSDVTGEAEGLTHVCDLHLPTDGGEDV